MPLLAVLPAIIAGIRLVAPLAIKTAEVIFATKPKSGGDKGEWARSATAVFLNMAMRGELPIPGVGVLPKDTPIPADVIESTMEAIFQQMKAEGQLEQHAEPPRGKITMVVGGQFIPLEIKL